MASPSVEYFRMSFDNVLQILPQGHEKVLKKAFYTTAANIIAAVFAIAVYFILEAFFRPLLWAFLCGTFLYPFKRSLTSILRGWLRGLHESGTPFAVGLVLLPVTVVDRVSESLFGTLMRYLHLLLATVLVVAALNIVYYFGPVWEIFAALRALFVFIYDVMEFFSSLWVWTFAAAYLLMVVYFWTPQSSHYMKYLSVPVFITLILHISAVAGALRVPLLIFVVVMMVIGFISEVNASRGLKEHTEDVDESTTPSSPLSASWARLTSPKQLPSSQIEPKTHEKPDTSSTENQDESSVENKEQQHTERSLSDQCFIALFLVFILERLWRHVWILELFLPVFILIILIKRLWRHFSGGGLVFQKFQNCKQCFQNWFEERRSVLVPTPVRGFVKLLIRGDSKLISVLERSLDNATSILFMLILLIGTVLFAVFCVFQVHQESKHLVLVTSNLLNRSVHPEMSQWLPNGEALQQAIDSMVGNVYLYSRDWIATKIHDGVQSRGGNTSQIEEKVLEVWDQLYTSWFARNTTTVVKPEFSAGGGFSNVTALWQLLTKGDGFNLGDTISFAKANIGTLMSVLDSVWTVLKGNISLAFTVITAVFSLLFGGGTALLNFIVSAVIFLTTLFYLLACSGDQYKPVEWFVSFGPAQGGNWFGRAFEEAISGVIMASLKMGAFYGLYTWVTHTFFGVNIAFIPSALAALFAAIPFVGSYWAAIPAILELWLVNQQGLLALLLAICHLLPTYIVDTAIYSEIKGGHPYMTGLAIAGGMYCLGLEGAIIGPIVLIVAITVYGTMLKPDLVIPNPSGGVPLTLGRPRLQKEKRVHWGSNWNQQQTYSTDH